MKNEKKQKYGAMGETTTARVVFDDPLRLSVAKITHVIYTNKYRIEGRSTSRGQKAKHHIKPYACVCVGDSSTKCEHSHQQIYYASIYKSNWMCKHFRCFFVLVCWLDYVLGIRHGRFVVIFFFSRALLRTHLQCVERGVYFLCCWACVVAIRGAQVCETYPKCGVALIFAYWQTLYFCRLPEKCCEVIAWRHTHTHFKRGGCCSKHFPT